MSRFSVGAAAVMLASAVSVLPAIDAASAQGFPQRGRGAAPAAPAARPAMPAARPPMARPMPQMRQDPMMRQHAPMARPQFQRPAMQPRMAVPQRGPAMIQRQRVAPNMQRFQGNRAAQRQQLRMQRQQQNVRRPGVLPNQAARGNPQLRQNQVQRLQRLQERRNLSRADRRELRQLRRAERLQPNVQGNPQLRQNQVQRLQRLQQQRNLSRADRREMRQLQRVQRQMQRQQMATQPLQQRIGRGPRVTQQQAIQSRFAANFMRGNADARRGDRRAWRLAARAAWRLGLYASYVPWRGPVYWPYAYNDIFYYTFWPDAYEPSYWSYAYDDFFDGIFFPGGAPYVQTMYDGPYDDYATGTTTGTRQAARVTVAPGRVSKAVVDFCAEQAKGITAWPIDRIEQAVQPTAEQRAMLNELKTISTQAAEEFKDACPKAVPLTPVGRLQAMVARLQAMNGAVKTVRPALASFYDSLSDEQKARFNELGPELDQRKRAAAPASDKPQANCSGEKAGLSNLAIERIEEVVQPTDAQTASLDKLDDATQKAVDTLRDACPTATPLTPVGRLEVMEKRIEAMIAAANTVRPALEDFYAQLSNEQKAKFNRLGRDTAQSGG